MRFSTLALGAFLTLFAGGAIIGCGPNREEKARIRQEQIAAEQARADSAKRAVEAESLRVKQTREKVRTDSLNNILDTIYCNGDSFSVVYIPDGATNTASKSIDIGHYGEGVCFYVSDSLEFSLKRGGSFEVPLKMYLDSTILASLDENSRYNGRDIEDMKTWTPAGSSGSGKTFKKDLQATIKYDSVADPDTTDSRSVSGKVRLTLKKPGETRSITYLLSHSAEYGTLETDSLIVQEGSATDIYDFSHGISASIESEYTRLQHVLGLVLGYLGRQVEKRIEKRELELQRLEADSLRRDSVAKAASRARLNI